MEYKRNNINRILLFLCFKWSLNYSRLYLLIVSSILQVKIGNKLEDSNSKTGDYIYL